MAERALDDMDDYDEGDEAADATAERLAVLDKLGMELASQRSAAINGRDLLGIEDEWIEDEEHYEGIDDANRGEQRRIWRSKPMGQADPPAGGDLTSSTIFFNITRPYCDAASARVGDMLLPTDDRAWSLRPTPVPDLVDIADGSLPPRIRNKIRAAFEGKPDAEEKIARSEQEAAAEAKKMVEIANERAKRAEARIEDWHVQGQYHAEMRKVLEGTSILGTGVLKGPIPMRKRQVAFKNGKLLIENVTFPVSVEVDVWNCFPDPACGESIHDGSFHFERDDISPMRLSRLKRQPGYLVDQIDMCLAEGPCAAVKDFDRTGQARPGLVERSGYAMFEIWYAYVNLSPEQVEACGCDMDDDDGELEEGEGGTRAHKSYEYVPAIVTMVNNRVIKASRNLLDTGEYPYDYMVWQRRAGMPYGIGVSRQIRPAQRVVNAAFRNMMDNAGLAGGPMWIYKAGLVYPLDGNPQIAPRKGWGIAEDADIDDVRDAFTFIEIPMRQQELQEIIMLGLKMAEDVTGLPMLLQGQMGQAPDTVGGMKILNDNAGAPLRRIARLYDDRITEPHVRRYYNYLLQYGEDEEKGDFQIDARGSTTLVERDLNNQAIMAMAQFVLNPVFGKDPKRWMDEWLKSQRLNPANFDYEDEDWKALVEQLAQSAQKGEPAVEVAQIRAELTKWVEQMKATEADKDREFDLAKLSLQDQYDEKDRQMTVALEALARDLENMKIGAEDRRTVEKVKADLAKVVMQLRTQRDLAGMKAPDKAPEASTPPTEPPGRAPAGEAYQR